MAPVKSAPVNDPKKFAVPGAKVATTAPQVSGTTIIPPGIFSIVRLILMVFSPRRHCIRHRASAEVYQQERRQAAGDRNATASARELFAFRRAE